MNSRTFEIDNDNAINNELANLIEVNTMTEEEEKTEREEQYAKYVKQLSYMQSYRERNREKYNENSRIKMKDNYRNNPIYKEKQQLAYYKKAYGVDTMEEVNKIKEERKQAKVKLILEKHNENPSKKKIDFETFINTKMVTTNKMNK
jgi:hypothetical protein